MKSYLVLAVLIIATGLAFYVVWMNRASEKIISAVLPISAAALLGVFMAVFVFGGESPMTVEFPAMFIFKSPENMPVFMPFRPMNSSLFLIQQMAKSHPEMLKDGAEGNILYHHLLQRAILDTLALRYRTSWEAKIVRFNTSIGGLQTFGPAEAATEPVKKFSREEIERALAGNRFANESSFSLAELAVPPETSLRIQPPMTSRTGGEESSITLDNPFIRITIRTHASIGGVLFGFYRLMLGQPNDTNTDLRQATYIVSIKREFKRLRTGHPDMPKYRARAEQITSEIQREFDEQLIWERAKEDYIFSKHLPGPVPQDVMLVGATEGQPATQEDPAQKK